MEASAAPRTASLLHRRPARLLRLSGDDTIVAEIRAGSEAAFEVLYDRHHRGILGFCRHMLGSQEEAEDAVQHTFMAAYRDLVGSDKAIQLNAWLYTIARNRCLTVLRARRERPSDDIEQASFEGLASEVERREELRDVVRDVAALPDDQRAALVLAEIGDVSHDEIAAILDCPKAKVKALVFQARSSLAASRQARDTSCAEIREQLANLRGGSLRRTTLRRHVKECPGCAAFRADMVAQRKALAVVLPVIPALGLKEGVLSAVLGGGGTAGAVAAGGGAAAGGAGTGIAAFGGGVVTKALVIAAVAGGGAAGVAAVAGDGPGSSGDRPSADQPAGRDAAGGAGGISGGSGGNAPAGAAGPGTATGDEDSEDGRRDGRSGARDDDERGLGDVRGAGARDGAGDEDDGDRARGKDRANGRNKGKRGSSKSKSKNKSKSKSKSKSGSKSKSTRGTRTRTRTRSRTRTRTRAGDGRRQRQRSDRSRSRSTPRPVKPVRTPRATPTPKPDPIPTPVPTPSVDEDRRADDEEKDRDRPVLPIGLGGGKSGQPK